MQHRPRSARFDDRYMSSAGEVRLLAGDLAAAIVVSSGLYKRHLADPHHRNLLEVLGCVIVNFLRLRFTDPGRCLTVPLSRGKSKNVRVLAKALAGLEILGYVHRFPHRWHPKKALSRVTAFEPMPKLLADFAAYPLDPTMVQLRERSPLVEIRPSKQMRDEAAKAGKELPRTLPWPAKHRGVKTLRIKKLRKINSALRAQFQAVYLPDQALAEALAKQGKPVDLFSRELHRVFTIDPYLNGRFAGAWWLTLPSKLRRHIRMNAPGKEPGRTVELDFQGFHFVMLYAAAGVPCIGDPYSIYDDPAKAALVRPVAKLVALMMINASSRQNAMRAATRRITKKFRKAAASAPEFTVDEMISELWPGCPGLDTVIRDIETKHTCIKGHFYSGAGRRLMFEDSELAEQIMLRMLIEHGVVPLCVHDSFIVRYDYSAALSEVMTQVFVSRFGVATPISQKASVKAPVIGTEGAYSLYDRMLGLTNRAA
jgi:hypothetical protein